MKYIKKPVVVEAWPYEKGMVPPEGCDLKESAFFNGGMICTPEGQFHIEPGNWIIKGVKGEFYSCRGDIFEMTYEAVE